MKCLFMHRFNPAYGLIIFLVACSQPKTNKSYVFDDDEAYRFMNDFFIPEHFNRDLLYVAERCLLQTPDSLLTIFYTSKGELFFSQQEDHLVVFPRYENRYWNKSKLNKVTLVSMDTLSICFDSASKGERLSFWRKRFEDQSIYNFSYPRYIDSLNILIIERYSLLPYSDCATGIAEIYIYERKDSNWVEPDF